MKTYPFDLANAENIARLFTITRGDEIIMFNDSDASIVIDGIGTFSAEPGAQVSALEFLVDGSVSNAQVLINAREDGPLSDADVAIGRYDGYPILIECCDTANLELGTGLMFTGFVGSVVTTISGMIKIDARGPLTRMRAEISERYGPMCRADLGDFRCKIPILPPDIERSTAYVSVTETLPADFVRVRVFSNDEPEDFANSYWECTTGGTTAGSQPSYAGALTPGATVTDGGAVFTNRNAWLRAAEVDAVLSPQSFTLVGLPDSRASVDAWYILATVIVRSGRYSGNSFQVRSWVASELKINTWDVCSHMLEAGTKLEIHRGCQKTEAECNVFNNIVNRRAEPFVPGRDAILAQG